MRSVGNRHTRRDQIAVDRPVVPDVDAFGRSDVARHLTLNHNRLRSKLRLDPTIRSDGQHILAQLDLTLDLAFDRQVLAAVQFSLDDDALADSHGDRLVPGSRFHPLGT